MYPSPLGARNFPARRRGRLGGVLRVRGWGFWHGLGRGYYGWVGKCTSPPEGPISGSFYFSAGSGSSYPLRAVFRLTVTRRDAVSISTLSIRATFSIFPLCISEWTAHTAPMRSCFHVSYEFYAMTQLVSRRYGFTVSLRIIIHNKGGGPPACGIFPSLLPLILHCD
jgi:hypothetical protein